MNTDKRLQDIVDMIADSRKFMSLGKIAQLSMATSSEAMKAAQQIGAKPTMTFDEVMFFEGDVPLKTISAVAESKQRALEADEQAANAKPKAKKNEPASS